MNLIELPTLNHRKPTDNSRDSRSFLGLEREPSGRVKRVDGHRPKHRGKPAMLRLGHIHLKVRSLNRSVPFYIRVLGLRLSEWMGRYAFLAAGEEHHSIALEEIGAWAVNPSRRAGGVAHIAFQVPHREAFIAMRKRLLRANLPFISRNNGISWAIRFKDPDGNEVEIYLDRRHASGGTQLWGGRWHLPAQWDKQATEDEKDSAAVVCNRASG